MGSIPTTSTTNPKHLLIITPPITLNLYILPTIQLKDNTINPHKNNLIIFLGGGISKFEQPEILSILLINEKNSILKQGFPEVLNKTQYIKKFQEIIKTTPPEYNLDITKDKFFVFYFLKIIMFTYKFWIILIAFFTTRTVVSTFYSIPFFINTKNIQNIMINPKEIHIDIFFNIFGNIYFIFLNFFNDPITYSQ